MKKECILYDRECIGCGECMFCELDPTKICDNCGKCIDCPDDYVIKVDYENESGHSHGHFHKDDCCDDDCGCSHDHHH